MKRFSAQYIITATGDILKRGIITCNEKGEILDVQDTGGNLNESASIEYHNGIIVPGFVNCHAHLELSDMKDSINQGSGLSEFINGIREKRNPSEEKAIKAIRNYDRIIYQSGTSAVADICNSSLTFGTKELSSVEYINLLEIFGLNPYVADQRLEAIISLQHKAEKHSLKSNIVPHSVYSVSSVLFEKLKKLISGNDISSIHFMESLEEIELINNASGPLIKSFADIGIDNNMLQYLASSHSDAILNYMPETGNLILVHNTYADKKTIAQLSSRPSTWWCLCPASNLYIENSLPPLEELLRQKANIVLGTDSLASNHSLNLLDEMILLQQKMSFISLNQLITWACKNGAEALNMPHLGTIEKGKRPGLVLLENCDLENIRLKASSSSTRLI